MRAFACIPCVFLLLAALSHSAIAQELPIIKCGQSNRGNIVEFYFNRTTIFALIEDVSFGTFNFSVQITAVKRPPQCDSSFIMQFEAKDPRIYIPQFYLNSQSAMPYNISDQVKDEYTDSYYWGFTTTSMPYQNCRDPYEVQFDYAIECDN